MTYFNNGRPTGESPLPPQAASNGIAGLIGMMPPQAQAGLGQGNEAETPAVIDAPAPGIPSLPQGPARAFRDGTFGRRAPETYGVNILPFRDGVFGPGLGAEEQTPQSLSPELPHGARAFRDGTFGRRAPAPYGVDLYPWRDGVFGPALGQVAGPVLDLNDVETLKELKSILNLLVGSYTYEQEGWGQPSEAAYVTFVEEQTPGYADKDELYQRSDGVSYPTARGIFVLFNATAQEWRKTFGPAAGDERNALMYPIIAEFLQRYEAADMDGTVIPPGATQEGEPGGGIKVNTVVMWGLGAVAVGLGVVALSKRKKGATRTAAPFAANPRRRKKRR